MGPTEDRRDRLPRAKRQTLGRSSRPSRLRQLRERRYRRVAELKTVQHQLTRIGVGSGVDRAAVREREALRRRRLSLLVEIEKLDRWIEVQKRPLKGGKRVVQGPKGGVRVVLQGGSPGSGKRA